VREQPGESEQFFRQAITIGEKAATELDWDTLNTTYIERLEIVNLAYNNLGVALLARGSYKEAEAAYGKAIAWSERLVARFPALKKFREDLSLHLTNHAFVLRTLNRLQESDRDIRKAVGVREQMLVEAPADAESFDLLADSYRTLSDLFKEEGRAPDAEQVWSDARAFNERLAGRILGMNDPSVQNDIAWRLATTFNVSLRNPTLAIKLARKALETKAEAWEIWNTLGVAQYRAGDFTGAIESLRKSLELGKGGDGSDYCFLAMANWKLGDKAKASECCDQALQWMGSTATEGEELPRFLAEMINLMGPPTSSEGYGAFLESAAPVMINNLAWHLAANPEFANGFPAFVVEMASKAAERTPTERGYWNTLGAAQYRARNWKAAIEALEKSMGLSKGGDSHDWFFLGMAYWKLGNKKQGRLWYDKALEWMDENAPYSLDLRHLRAEAAEVLGIKEQTKTGKGAKDPAVRGSLIPHPY